MRKSGNGRNVDFEQFVDDIKAVVRDGEELLKAGVTEVKQRALTGAKSTGRAVRENPYQTLGIVFGLGILAGIVMTRHFTIEEDDE
jgi:ElaB/YqjD/DUF883 family membrane-anchored ribosome-binding protein